MGPNPREFGAVRRPESEVHVSTAITYVTSAPKAASILKRDASDRAIDVDSVTFRTKISLPAIEGRYYTRVSLGFERRNSP